LKNTLLAVIAIVLLATATSAEPKKQVATKDFGDLIQIVALQQKEISAVMDEYDMLDARIAALEKPAKMTKYQERKIPVDITKSAW
jgi:hypothetical protein